MSLSASTPTGRSHGIVDRVDVAWVHSPSGPLAASAPGRPCGRSRGTGPSRPSEPATSVLTQDTRTGALTYQPVVAAFHNPPSATLRVGLGEDTVVATGIHRFWVAGRGWVMARELKVGDPVRTLGGVARVGSVEEVAGVQPVFNLEVAGGHSFLVGGLGALVHDNSLVEPVLDPFDAAPVSVAGRSE